MLTSGAIQAIINDPKTEKLKTHLLQAFEIKSKDETQRVLKLSDGSHFIRAVVSAMVPVITFDILKIEELRLVEIKGSYVLLIDSFSIAFTGLNTLLGKPVEFIDKVLSVRTKEPKFIQFEIEPNDSMEGNINRRYYTCCYDNYVSIV